MQGENGTPASIMRAIVCLMLVTLLTLNMSITASACEYYGCDELPPDITDCPICIYEEWDAELKEYTKELCEEEGIRYSLVLAIIWNESRFESDAIGVFNGQKCSYGLMQIEYVNLEWLQDEIGISELDDLLDPKTNIQAGIAILKYYEPNVSTEQQMVLRYQVGEGRYSELVRSGIYTTSTCNKVMNMSYTFEANI